MPTASKTTASSQKTPKKPLTAPSRVAASPDAVKLLKADHKEVKGLFEEYDKLVKEEAEAETRQALASQICAMLTVHATIEEEIFYPAAREALEGGEDLLDEAEVEHACAKDLIAQIESSSPDDELYDAKVKVLGEYIQHHVDEEEGELFPKVKKTDLDLDALAEELSTRKQELTAQV